MSLEIVFLCFCFEIHKNKYFKSSLNYLNIRLTMFNEYLSRVDEHHRHKIERENFRITVLYSLIQSIGDYSRSQDLPLGQSYPARGSLPARHPDTVL